MSLSIRIVVIGRFGALGTRSPRLLMLGRSVANHTTALLLQTRQYRNSGEKIKVKNLPALPYSATFLPKSRS